MDAAPITTAIPRVYLLTRGVDTEISCPLERAGAAVEVTDGDVLVTGPTGAVATDTVTVTAGVPSYVVDGDDTAALALGDHGWLVTWTLTVSGETEPVVVRSPAALVRTCLRPVIAAGDLYRRVPALDPASRSAITRDDAGTSHQWAIDESWSEIEDRLLDNGRRPWLVLSPGALRLVHLHAALALIFEDLDSRLSAGVYAMRAEQHRRAADVAWDRLDLRYDTDRDGAVDESVGGSATVWLL